MASTFLAVQFEFTHAIGPHAGRYVVAHPSSVDADGAALRSDELSRRQLLSGQTMAAGTADVLALTVVAAAAPAAARPGRIRRRSREADVAAGPADVPLMLATFIRATEPMAEAEADALLLRIAEDDDAQQVWIADGLRVLNRAIRAYRAGSRDPYVTEVAQRDARFTRLGYGTTESLPDGRFTRAAILPPPVGVKPTREERLQPAETTADVLAGRTTILEGEDLLLRAYTDLDHGRTRAAALQVRAAVHLLELEFAAVEGGGALRADFESLAARADQLVAGVAVGPLGDADRVELEALLDNLERAIELWRYTPKI